MTFLEETIQFLKIHGKTESDVEWCGSTNYYFSWNHFKEIATFENFQKDNVPIDFIVVGKYFWLMHETDYFDEKWKFMMVPEKPQESCRIKSLEFRKISLSDYVNRLYEENEFCEVIMEYLK